MAQDSRFGKGGDDDTGKTADVEPHSSPVSRVRPFDVDKQVSFRSVPSGVFPLRLVRKGVDEALNIEVSVLNKLLTAEPQAQILWNTGLAIGIDMQVIEKRLSENTRADYFLNLLREYLITVSMALDLRRGNRSNVHVFQNKDDVRLASETFASTKDPTEAGNIMVKIRAAIQGMTK